MPKFLLRLLRQSPESSAMFGRQLIYTKISPLSGLSSALLIFPLQAMGGYTVYEEGDIKFQLSGDLRLRFEQDWDSQTGSGSMRDDRARIRARARARLDGQFNEDWKAVIRLRSGNNDSQQSPFFTLYDFQDNPKGPTDFNLDLWYAQYSNVGWNAWAGRNQLNIWRQDEFAWDDDVTIMGAGLSYAHALGEGKLDWKGSYGALPAGMQNDSGTVATAQVVYDREFASVGLTLAGSYINIAADPDDADGSRLLLNQNNTRDYQIVITQLQLRTTSWGQPLKFGANYGHNLKDYDNAAPGSFSEFHKDDVNYYSVFATWGPSNQRGDWLFGYYYAYVEALAVNSSYAQDDWVRWGDVSQTRATNMKGSEFRSIYTINNKSNVTARMYLVDAIDLLNPGDTAKEDGNRFRIDYNISF